MFTAINYQLSGRMLVSRTWPHWSVSPFWHSAVLIVQQTCRSDVCCSTYEHTQRLIDRQLNFYVRIIYCEWFVGTWSSVASSPWPTWDSRNRISTPSHQQPSDGSSFLLSSFSASSRRYEVAGGCVCASVPRCLPRAGSGLKNCNLAIAGWIAGVCTVQSSTSLVPNSVWKRFQTAWV